MSSPFSSALAQLDGTLKDIHLQVNCLEAALDVNDDRLLLSLNEARHHAAKLRDLVRAERPDAHWEDRSSLAKLVRELEAEAAARAKRDQERREKLSALAGELANGTIKHRFETRKTALNDLKTSAVEELRLEADAQRSVRELPGPEARQWLNWACGLVEAKDGAVLAQLRQNFPALEHFAGEMEKGYWVPSPRPSTPTLHTALFSAEAEPARPEVRLDVAPQPHSSNTDAPQPKANTPTEDDYTGTSDPALLSSYGTMSAAAAEPDQALIEVIASAPHVKLCENCGGTFPEKFLLCPFDGTDLRPIAKPAPPTSHEQPKTRKSDGKSAAPSARVAPPARTPESAPAVTSDVKAATTNGDTPEPADVEFERLKTILQRNSDTGEFQLLDTSIPRKTLMAAGTAAAAVLLSAILGFAYHSSAAGGVRKLRSTVMAAGGIAPTVVPDADIQREIERKLALVKGSNIQATVDEGVVTLVGRSSSRWEALHAENLASQTAGVTGVKNEVEVEPDPPEAPTKKSHGKPTKM
jgi:BON domain